MLMLIRAAIHLQQTFPTVPPLICSSSGQELTYDTDGDQSDDAEDHDDDMMMMVMKLWSGFDDYKC